MRAIRDGLTLQQTMLNEIVGLLQPIVGAMGRQAANPGDPATSAEPPTTAPRASAAASRPPHGLLQPGVPAISTRRSTTWPSRRCADAIKRFPDYPDAARAQCTIGESYYQSGKHKEALAAFTAVDHQLQGSRCPVRCAVQAGTDVRAAWDRMRRPLRASTRSLKFKDSSRRSSRRSVATVEVIK